MCDHKILAHASDGYVILCNICGHYQLAFGTTAVTFEPQQFTSFCKDVEEIAADSDCNGFEKKSVFQ